MWASRRMQGVFDRSRFDFTLVLAGAPVQPHLAVDVEEILLSLASITYSGQAPSIYVSSATSALDIGRHRYVNVLDLLFSLALGHAQLHLGYLSGECGVVAHACRRGRCIRLSRDERLAECC